MEHAKNVRNYHLGLFEKVNIGMNLLLCFLGFIMILSGISFISNDLIGQTHFSMRNLKNQAATLIVCYLVIIPCFGLTGILIAQRRQCHSFFTAMWGMLIFFVLAIPLLAEGTIYMAIDNISNE